MTVQLLNIVIDKKSKFYKKFQTTGNNGTPRTLVGKTIKCVIKESTATDTVLFTLTENNGGIVVVDDAEGIFALSIDSDDTNVDADYGFYQIIEENSLNTETEDVRLIEGKVTFSKAL